MSTKLLELLTSLIPFAVILFIGLIVSWIFYFIRKRDIFGGFVGGTVIAILGALLGIYADKFILDYVIKALQFLVYHFNVNIIASFIGAYIAVYITNKLNHDKKRDRF
ncbi:MAG: hypothetical protein ACOCWH_01105 [Spirochaetota bacterium]